MGPGETHHSKQRERGQVSPLLRGLCRKQDPPPTRDCSLLLSSRQSNLWKACIGRLWIFNFFFFNPRIDVTLASIHILGVQLWRLPLWTVWELTPTDLGAESQQSWQLWTAGDSLTSPAGILQTGLGRGHRGAFVHVDNVSDSQWRQNPSWKTFGKSSLLFPPLRDLQSNQDNKG